MRIRIRFIASILTFVFACACSQSGVQTISNGQGIPLEDFRAVGRHAMVASPNEQASQIGKDILKSGGNAIDAAIAVSFAISVLRPQSTGIGGGGFMLLAKDGKKLALDFRERAPFASKQKLWGNDTKKSQEGPLSVAVPGLVAGLWKSYQEFGSKKIPWKDLVAPSIELAEKGFAVYPHLARASKVRQELLRKYTDSSRLFLPKGEPLKIGYNLVQKDLAKTLAIIADKGADGFYKGSVASKITRFIRKEGGILKRKDLSQYAVVAREPIEGTFLGHTIYSMPPPSSGGIHLVEMLNVLELSPLVKRGFGHPESAHWMVEAMRRAYADRAQYLGDPDFISVPQKGLVSKRYAEGLFASINPKKATPSREIIRAPSFSESNSTAHFSIVDSWGNAVSSTQTINYYFGSGMTVPGTGIVLNDEMDDFALQPGVPNTYGLVGGAANAIAPGKRPLSSMSPTIVFDPKGELFMVVGTPGGSKIITAVLQVLINSIAHKADPLNSVAAGRIHHQWLPDRLFYEKEAFQKGSAEELVSMGHQLEQVDFFVTDIQLIQKKANKWVGVSDPRHSGRPAGY